MPPESYRVKILETICTRLFHNGLMPVEIKRLVKDVLNIIEYGGIFNHAILQQELEGLGWEDNIFDSHTLELILCYLECEGTYKVKIFNIQ